MERFDNSMKLSSVFTGVKREITPGFPRGNDEMQRYFLEECSFRFLPDDGSNTLTYKIHITYSTDNHIQDEIPLTFRKEWKKATERKKKERLFWNG